MCVVSNIGDYFKNGFPKKYPNVDDFYRLPEVTMIDLLKLKEEHKKEIDSLRKEIQELKKLLLAAKKFDEKTEQPNCETDEKVALLKKVAELVGVDLSKVFDK